MRVKKVLEIPYEKPVGDKQGIQQYYQMLIPMSFFLVCPGMYFKKFAFLNIGVPTVHIWKIMVKPNVSFVPHITVRSKYVKQEHISFIGAFALK